jgi:hypothetical protein
MQTNTITVVKSNVTPIQQICVNVSDTDAQPPSDVTTDVDYDTLTTEQKALFDDTVAMIESLG